MLGSYILYMHKYINIRLVEYIIIIDAERDCVSRHTYIATAAVSLKLFVSSLQLNNCTYFPLVLI